MKAISALCVVLWPIACGGRAEKNIFSFCKDFTDTVCRDPLQEVAAYPIEKSQRRGTMRDFWNSIYFRGDRLAFELRNADARRTVDFDCLYGRYHLDNESNVHHELEYIELKGNNVYGLVMLGSLVEKRFASLRNQPYRKIERFSVTYSVFCRNDLLARATIAIELR